MSRSALITSGPALRAERLRALGRRIAVAQRPAAHAVQRATASATGTIANFNIGLGVWQDVPAVRLESNPGVWQPTGLSVTIDAPTAQTAVYLMFSWNTDMTNNTYDETLDSMRLVTSLGHVTNEFEIVAENLTVATPLVQGAPVTYTLQWNVGNTLAGFSRFARVFEPKLTAFVLS